MNMFKKNGGFTLVELIVVIAILAILAGVAVPAYSGYIQKAHEAADVTQLDAIKTAAVFKYTEDKVTAAVNPIPAITSITVSNKGVVKVNNDTVNISAYCTFNAFKSTTYSTNGAKWAPATGWQAGN